jgi:ADP-ribosylglycohydrolase
VIVIARRHGAEEAVSIEWSGDGVRLHFRGRTERVPRVVAPNGEYDDYAALVHVAQELGPTAELVACGSCLHFGFSGMLGQATSRRVGYCGRVGYRQTYALVRIDYGCGEHRITPGWPADQDQAWEARDVLGMRSPWPDRSNAFRGCLLGLAVGDALGYPAEFHTRARILEDIGPRGVEGFFPGDGRYSDDTQLSLVVAEALVAAGTNDVDSLMREMARRFIAWSTSPENDRAPGATTLAGCKRLAEGVDWHEAGLPESKDAGSAVRVAPIGLVCWRDPARAVELARASSRLTHRHEAAIEGAAAAALLVSLAMRKRPPEEMHRAVLEECGSRSPDLARRLRQVPDFLDTDAAVALSRHGLGEGWVAEEVVACALYCFWRSPEDYRATVLTAVNGNGDSDAIGCIAGGISGAFNGLDAIPHAWRAGIENADALLSVADRLWMRATGGIA